MEDISGLVGTVSVEWKDKDGKPVEYRLDAYQPDDWSVLQDVLLTEKRERILKTVVGMRDKVPAATFSSLMGEAMQEVGNIVALDMDDLHTLMGNAEGMGLMIWVLFQRCHPGKVTREEAVEMFKAGVIDETKAVTLVKSLQKLMGNESEPEGNEESQPESE